MPIKPNSRLASLCLFFSVLIIGLAGCKKDLNEQQAAPEIQKTANLEKKINPYSLRNVQKALDVLSKKDPSRHPVLSMNMAQQATTTESSTYPTYIYFRFNPANITQAEFLAMENDTTVTLMDFPFANAAMYENASITEDNIGQYRDGKVYGITLSTNPIINSIAASPGLQTELLDTLVLVPDSDTELQTLSMQQAAMSVNICLPTRPSGRVQYQDNELDLPSTTPRMEAVRGMQVWALVYGIPITTYTDANGNYTIPRWFSVGTIMGTKAKNHRVNIKPLDTHGALALMLHTIGTQFIVGSLHVKGWASPCNRVDFNFTGHTQVRYWSHLLNAYFFHDQFSAQDQVPGSPSNMTCYAIWRSQPGVGAASTFMLGHMSKHAAVVEYIINDVFDGNVSLLTNFPKLPSLIDALLPDMTFKVGADAEPADYSSDLTQTAFHELGHASHFRQVGHAWWIQLAPTIFVPRNPTGEMPYGDGTDIDAERVSLAEAWAEYIGKTYGSRRYPNSTILGTTRTTPGGPWFDAQMAFLLENEGYFFGGEWIPYGLFHDLRDAYSAAEPLDNVAGVTINQMYFAFQPNIATWCGYANSFISRNTPSPTINVASTWQNFGRYLIDCGITVHSSDAINRLVQKNDCVTGVGTFVPINIPAGTFTSLISVADANVQAEAAAQSQANFTGTCTMPCPIPIIRSILASGWNTTATIMYTAPTNATTVVIYYFDPTTNRTTATYVTPGTSAVITFPARGRTYSVWMAYWSPGCNAITSAKKTFIFPAITQ